MLQALVIKELRCLMRDWHGLLVLFIMPAVFILVMSIALKDTFKPDVIAIGDPVIFADSSEELDWLVKSMGVEEAIIAPANNPTLTALETSKKVWGIHLSPSFDRDFWDLEKSVHVNVVAAPHLSMAVLQALQARVEKSVALLRIEHVIKPQLKQAGLTLNIDQLADVAAYHLVSEGLPLNAVQQSVPAWLVFGMFFVVIPLSNIVINERQQGTLFRLASLGVPAHVILMGKWLPFYAVNMLQAVLMIGVGHYVVPIFGGDTLALNMSVLALWVMVSAVSVAALGFAFMIASVARTTEQGTMLGGVGNILFAALGGVMVPTFIMPPAMRELAKLSPMNWGMEGITSVFTSDKTVFELWPSILVLMTMGLVLLVIASIQLQKAMHK